MLAPVFVAVFVGLGFWWGLPLTSAILLAALVAVSLRLPLRVETAGASTARPATGIPPRFWVYAGFAMLYGICETVNGNWSQLDMTDELGASTTEAALALTAFWAMVTVGRVLFAAIQRQFPSRLTFHLLPFVLAGAFVIIAVLPEDEPALGVLAFGLAGLGCSALLPLTISFGQEELKAFAAATAGGVIAFYQLGLRHRGLRRRPAPRRRRRPPDDLRRRGRDRRGHGSVVVRGGPPTAEPGFASSRSWARGPLT